MDNNPLKILLVGIGGFGQYHVKELLDKRNDLKFIITGIVEPNPDGCEYLSQLKALNIPFYSSIESYFDSNKADLTIITTPIHFHKRQVCYALQKGSNVLCEKPISATVQEAVEMKRVKEETGKILAIGFQWSFSEAILSLKKDILDGKLGKAKRLKAIIMWPRDEIYFSRSWAAKKKSPEGDWILDSIASNGTAHFLHNMLYILGDAIDESVVPESVMAELYRANDIENFDTVFARINTVNGAILHYYASHATKDTVNPMFTYEFEKGTVTFNANDKQGVKAVFNDGTSKNYGNPFEDTENKIWITMDAIRDKTIVPCGPEAALSQVICTNGMQESMPEIVDFPEDIVMALQEPKMKYVKGLDKVLVDCYDKWLLPSEMKIDWAKCSKKIDLKDYKYFSLDNISS